MATGFQGFVLTSLLHAEEVPATVLETGWAAPHLRRLRMRAPGVLLAADEPDAYLRMWFPKPGTSKQHQRAYTITEPDLERGEFTLLAVIHEPLGPAAEWFAAAEVGDRIPVMRYGEPKHPDYAGARGHLLVGDAASYPAARGLIPRLRERSAAPITALMLGLHDGDAELALPAVPDCEARWVPAPDPAAWPGLLAAELSTGDWRGWTAWVATETKATRAAKKALLGAGLEKNKLAGQAYWVRGRQLGRSRDAAAAGPST